MNNSLKHLVQKGLARGGLQLRRLRAEGGATPTYLLELICESLKARGAAGWLVQVGANDGLLDDHIYRLVAKQYWPAVLIEPFPAYFEKLSRNYAGKADVHLFNVAVGAEPGESILYTVDTSRNDLPPWVQGLGSFDRQVLLSHRNWPELKGVDLERLIVETRVPVATARQVLDRFGITGIPLLQVDTEGHDAVVVETFLASGARPLLINYEHKHLRFASARSLRELLTTHGYSLLDVGPDTLATHDGAIESLLRNEEEVLPAAKPLPQPAATAG